jgi:Fe2+ transport system protein FeoA
MSTCLKPSYSLKRLMTMKAQEDTRLDVLRSAPLNSWIALSEDESKIVAVGSTFSEVVTNSEKAGVSDPIIIKTPKAWAPLSV